MLLLLLLLILLLLLLLELMLKRVIRVINGGQGHDLNIGIVGINRERVATANGQLHELAHRYRLKYFNDVLMCITEHTLVIYIDKHVALPQTVVSLSGAIWHNVFYLEEVLRRLIGANYGETEAVRGF